MEGTHRTHIEIPVTVEYDHHDEEPRSFNDPGSPEQTDICGYRINGHDMTSFKKIDMKPLLDTLAALKAAGINGTRGDINHLIGQLDTRLTQLQASPTLHDALRFDLEEVEEGIIQQIQDDLYEERMAAVESHVAGLEDRADAYYEECKLRRVV